MAGGAEADAAAGEEEKNVEVKQEEAKHDGNSESSRRIPFLLHPPYLHRQKKSHYIFRPKNYDTSVLNRVSVTINIQSR